MTSDKGEKDKDSRTLLSYKITYSSLAELKIHGNTLNKKIHGSYFRRNFIAGMAEIK